MSGNRNPASSKLRKPLIYLAASISAALCFPGGLYSQDIGITSSVSTSQLSGRSKTGKAGEYIWLFDGSRIILESQAIPEALIEDIRNPKLPNLSIERDSVLSWQMNKTDFSLNIKSSFPDHIAKANSSGSTGSEKVSSVIKYQPARFTIAGANIPQDLVKAITGSDGKVNLIRGTWKIAGSKIVFSNVVVNGSNKSDKVGELEIFFTGVIRIATSEKQYVF